MVTPEQLGLPYGEWRPTQLEAVLRAAELLQTKKYVVVEAPAGAGKTGIAAGVARFMQVPSLYLTATKDLQRQYHDLLDVPTVTGRSNWTCLIDDRVTAAQGKCIGGTCEYAGLGASSKPGCCLAPETRVLRSDLTWVTVGSLVVGNELIGFDEHPHLPSERRVKRRQFQRSQVEAVGRRLLPARTIRFTNGPNVTASDGHLWLTKNKSSSLVWKRTDALVQGDSIVYCFRPWAEDRSYEAGYMAGFLDGEGSVWRKAVTFAQNPGPTLDLARGLLDSYSYKTVCVHNEDTERRCQHVHITGRAEMLHLLGSVRPPRLLAKAACVWEGTSTATHLQPREVKEVLDAGVCEVVALQTSTRTLIAEGMLTHNSYYDQLREGVAAEEVVLNYSYFLHAANYAGNFKNRPLVVCDEAHALRGELEGFIQTELSLASLRKYHVLGPDDRPDDWELVEWLAWALDAVVVIGKRLTSPVTKEEANALSNLKTTLTTLLSVGGSENLILEKRPTGPKFRPIVVSGFAKKYLFRHGEKFLLLTATPGDLDVFCASLGIPVGEAAIIRCPSSFDKTRRPLIYRPQGKVSGQDAVASARQIVPMIDTILDGHPDQKGLIHTVSYRLAVAIKEQSRHKKRMMSHLSESREAALGKFRESTEPTVLLSPSLATGVDLPYDLLRFQIIAKLPFPDQTDPVVRAQQATALGKKLGLQDTALTFAQMYGRGMRAEDDFCTCYALDGNWDWFRHAARSSIPRWVTEAIVYE